MRFRIKRGVRHVIPLFCKGNFYLTKRTKISNIRKNILMLSINVPAFNAFISNVMDHTMEIFGPKKLYRFISMNLKASVLIGFLVLFVFIVLPQTRAWFTGYLTILFWFIVMYLVLRMVSAIGFIICYLFASEEIDVSKQKEFLINILALFAILEFILYGLFLMKKQA
jgi:inner membrane protein involved in colicin E2 resistance